jgi:tetratricopeptide (TPR) repeat protein
MRDLFSELAKYPLQLIAIALVGVFCWYELTKQEAQKTPLERGIEAQENGDYDKAIADYTLAIQLDPNNKEAYDKLGCAYLDQDDYFLAVACYSELIKLDQKNADAYLNRGDAYRGKGNDDQAIADYSQAIQLYDQAIQLNPKDAFANLSRPIAYHDRGLIYDDKGDYDKAIADYSQAIQLDPKRASFYHDRGLACKHKGDYDRAIADYDQAIQLEPKYAKAYDALAWLLATCPQAAFRDGKKAVENATKACDLSQWKNPYLVDTLAAACAEAGDFDNAVRWENKYLETPNLNASDAADAKSRLALYQTQQPYHADK